MVAAIAVTHTVLAAPPAYNWTGFYVGVNAGGSFGRNPTTELNATFGTLIGSFTLLPDGFAGGGQIGYNYQFDRNWIVGVEGDFQGMSQSASNCSGLGCTVPGGAYFTVDQKLLWFATARARFGYTNGDWLLYVTGGGAWGEVHNDFRVFTPLDAGFDANFNLHGWTAGGGVEKQPGGGWTAKLEYLYLDLGSFTDGGFDPLSGSNFTMTSDVRDHIIRAGLNYKFH